jgi:hypothetical protein
MSCPQPHHTQHGAGPGSSPTSHHRTSGGAGYRRSSSSRTFPAGPATGTPPGSGRRSRRGPAGDHSTGAPAADAQAATAPAAPTPHRSGHAVSGDPHPRPNPSGDDPPRSTGHALARPPSIRRDRGFEARHPDTATPTWPGVGADFGYAWNDASNARSARLRPAHAPTRQLLRRTGNTPRIQRNTDSAALIASRNPS